MMLPLRAVFSGPDGNPTTVDIRVDDRWIANIELTDPSAWVRPLLPIGGSTPHPPYSPAPPRFNRPRRPLLPRGNTRGPAPPRHPHPPAPAAPRTRGAE